MTEYTKCHKCKREIEYNQKLFNQLCVKCGKEVRFAVLTRNFDRDWETS